MTGDHTRSVLDHGMVRLCNVAGPRCGALLQTQAASTRLRTHDHAQIEARKYAEAIVDLLRGPLPGLMSLFAKHVRKPA